MASLTLDLHTHLVEKNVKPHIFWRSAIKIGLDVVGITEHVEENPRISYDLLAENKPKGIVLLPGMELNTSIGHVVAIGKSPEIYKEEKFLKKGLDIKKAIKLAEQYEMLLSIAHPWGFGYDSASYIIGEKKLEKLVEKEVLGVEVFNGMMGSVGNFVYATNWIQKPLNFFDFLQKNRIAKKTRLDRIGRKLGKRLDKETKEVAERCAKPFELGEKAAFITAGSDAHYADKIGSGMIKIRTNAIKPDNASVVEMIKEKERVVWAGPRVKEMANGQYKVFKITPNKMEIIGGVKYATISKGKKKIRGIGSSINERIKRNGKK